MENKDAEIARLTAERDQALARAASAAMEMREQAAAHAWNKRELLADAEKRQVESGLSSRHYYGRRLEAEMLSRSIRALPLDPDAEAALKRHDAALIERCADVVEDYCSDIPDLAGHGHSVGIKDAIRALAHPTEGE